MYNCPRNQISWNEGVVAAEGSHNEGDQQGDSDNAEHNEDQVHLDEGREEVLEKRGLDGDATYDDDRKPAAKKRKTEEQDDDDGSEASDKKSAAKKDGD